LPLLFLKRRMPPEQTFDTLRWPTACHDPRHLRPRPRPRRNGRWVTRGGSIQPIKVRGTSATKD
jgi:hypothetical protein